MPLEVAHEQINITFNLKDITSTPLWKIRTKKDEVCQSCWVCSLVFLCRFPLQLQFVHFDATPLLSIEVFVSLIAWV